MDKLNSHKVSGVEEAIRSVGTRIRYLPPYSPDLNPIELMFSKLKHLLRAADERSLNGLWPKIGELLSLFPAKECENYIRHAGYKQL